MRALSSSRRRGALTVLAVGIAASLAASAGAQNFERIAPRELPTTPPPEVPTPPSPAQPAIHDPSAQVVPMLRGLAFVASRDAVNPAGVSMPGISASGLAPLETAAFQQAVSPFIGKSLSFGDLHAITEAVVEAYAANGHPLVRAVAPEQNVDSGTIQIVVLEYRVGTVSVEGNRHFPSRLIAAPFHLQHGDAIESDEISTALDVANANPFRRVELVYRPSQEVGFTDLVVQTQDRLPFRPYVGYDNNGPRSTGENRWSLGFNWGNAFGLDQQLSYQLTTSDNFWSGAKNSNGSKQASFVAHSLIWSIPLPWNDRIVLFGAYERTHPDIGPDFDLTGKAGQASIRYEHRLPRWGAVSHNIQVGFDFKTTNNNLDFGGLRVSRSQTEIDQFLAIYSGTRPDRRGATSLTATVVYSPGGISGANHDVDFQPTLTKPGRLGATADYVYFRGEIGRQTVLPLDASWSIRLIGQIANRPLLETEQVSVGGPDLLRGYQPNSINGDEGIAISNELRTPNLIRTGLHRLVLLGFLDYANLSNKQPATGQASKVEAVSTGVGLRYSWATHVVIKADYGWQLKRLPSQPALGSRGVLSVILAY